MGDDAGRTVIGRASRAIAKGEAFALEDLEPVEPEFTRSERGFKHMEPMLGTYPKPWSLRVYESSAAEEASVWIAAESEGAEVHVHVSLERAAEFAAQVSWLVANHYQVVPPGDAVESSRG